MIKIDLKRRAVLLLLAVLCSFTGAWAQKALPYEYGFEDNDLSVDGWTAQSVGTENVDKFGIIDVAKQNGDYGFRFSSYDKDNESYDQYLISPELSAASGVTVQFYYKNSYSSAETFKVGYSTTDNDISSFTFGEEISATGNSWKLFEETFPAGTKFVAIHYYSNYKYYLYVDDFSFTVPESCIKPISLNATPNALNATITWESEATSFTIAHSTDASAEPDNVIVGTSTETSYEFTSLALGDHFVWVRTNCSETEHSAWAGPISFHIGHCVPAPTSVDNNGISNVTFGMGDYIVNNDTPKATYADYTSQIGAVQAGVESTIAITFKTGYTYNAYVWVDLDNSLSFDADEVVCYGESGSTNPTTLTLNFTIPANQTLGDFRLRIGSADSGLGSSPSAANPCYTGSYACFQDYTLRVLEAPSCVTPTGLTVTTDGATATATWEGTATTYNIDINGTITNNVTSPYEFPVELSTDYTVMVQANCGAGEYSDWSNAFNFTTPDCIGGHVIEYTLTDQYGDGWNGAAIIVMEGCGNIVETLTLGNGNSASGILTLCGDYYEFIWQKGNYDSECSFTFTENGTILFTKPSTLSDGKLLYYLGIQACPKPAGLAAGTPGAHEVELSWTENGEADNWQICINGDEEHLINVNANPYTLTGLTADTDYSIIVRAYCDATHQSCWSDAVSFTTAPSCPKPTGLAAGTPGAHEVELHWTENGEADNWQICINDDEEHLINVNANPYTLAGLTGDTEYTVKVRAYCSSIDQSRWSDAVAFTTAEACAKPTNLAESNITTTSADLSWDGTNDSYVLQYRPWNPAGDDVIATSTMTTYTYDLSAFSGTGSVAIRHYDISDVFQLVVDDIEVKNADNDVVFSEDFESCGGSMPAALTNMDLDGDGFVWGIASSPSTNVNGSYGIVSASWDSSAGALHPDNWLIISGIPMGGSISFKARGQDPNYPAENFAVYVSTENSIVEVPQIATTYNATGLTPNTPYAWQVKGVCGGGDESRFVSSFFKTKDDVLIFATDGNWNDVTNWTDAEGNAAVNIPTVSNNVRIDAEAIIPAGVIAVAKKATLGDDGSVTIQDGGQLKQSSASLWVTMEKEVTANKNFFIGSPFSGTTQIVTNPGTWSYVLNLISDEYDLYGFDPTQELEWANYKANSEHAVFTAGNNYGLVYGSGYLCANAADQTLEFTGTTGLSVNNTITKDVDFDNTSTNFFNGWSLIGNPFTCTGYVYYVDDSDDLLPATFYKLNAAGDGYDVYDNAVSLAPGEGAFIKVAASGKILFSSEDLSLATIAKTGTADLPLLPQHGQTTDQNANSAIDITLYNADDNDAIITVNEGELADVKLSGRTLYKDGSWNSMCLPFDLTIAGSPLDGATVKVLDTSTTTFESNTFTVHFTDAPATIYAGTPFVVKWASGSNISDPVFTGVTIEDAATTVSFSGGTFIGTYSPVTLTKGDMSQQYFGSDDKLYWPNADNIVLKSFRAYFDLDGVITSAPNVVIDFGEGATAIENVSISNEANETWYTIDGRKLDSKPTQKGVYIVNGRKQIVK
jgi:hypothetical protein